MKQRFLKVDQTMFVMKGLPMSTSSGFIFVQDSLEIEFDLLKYIITKPATGHWNHNYVTNCSINIWWSNALQLSKFTAPSYVENTLKRYNFDKTPTTVSVHEWFSHRLLLVSPIFSADMDHMMSKATGSQIDL